MSFQDETDIRQWLKVRQEELGLENEVCAARAGVSDTSWSHYRTELSPNSRHATFIKVAAGLGVPVEEVLIAASHSPALAFVSLSADSA